MNEQSAPTELVILAGWDGLQTVRAYGACRYSAMNERERSSLAWLKWEFQVSPVRDDLIVEMKREKEGSPLGATCRSMNEQSAPTELVGC